MHDVSDYFAAVAPFPCFDAANLIHAPAHADVSHGCHQKGFIPVLLLQLTSLCQLYSIMLCMLCLAEMCSYMLLCRYGTFLFYGSSKTKEMCYYTHLADITKVFNILGILSSKKTHAPRGSGARDTHERR